MKVLLVGSGGREHALAWKLKQSSHCTHLFCAPGNPGMAALGTCVGVRADDIPELIAFAHDMHIELTVVGPETPLAAGLVDAFQKEGLPIFGPTRAAARIETSKAFAKTVMKMKGVPAGRAVPCPNEARALAALDEFTPPYVIKADGLAAGKGVVIAPDRAAAETAIRTMMRDRAFGAAGDLVLVEEFLDGEEVSLFAISDGRRGLAMVPAQDHKRIGDGDTGPNTGGMGAYTPVPHLAAGVVDEAMARVITPVIEGMAEQGTPFRGLLYAGLILTRDGLKVIEFNCRFGDPETQAVLPLLDEDLLLLMMESVGTGFARDRLRFSRGAAACVVAASGGYPGEYRSGLAIQGLEAAGATGALIFHAGTRMMDGSLRTAGGRVLNVVGRAASLEGAVAAAYTALEQITFDGMHYRRDIASRALTRRTP